MENSSSLLHREQAFLIVVSSLRDENFFGEFEFFVCKIYESFTEGYRTHLSAGSYVLVVELLEGSFPKIWRENNSLSYGLKFYTV